MRRGPGIVYLVGAGPGDPGLMTVKGLELVRFADVILHDRLAPVEVLSEAKPDAEIIDVGKSPGRHALPQSDINHLLVEKAHGAEIVVRLKGGDPFIFGRGAEESAACREAGIDCVVIPGISSAVAAPAAAGIPVTHRGVARSFAVVTGRTDDADGAPAHDYEALAKIDTLVLMMGRSNLHAIAKSLIAAGRDPETPAACIASGTTGRQRVVAATLATIAAAVDRAELSAPVVTVIGETAAFADSAGRGLDIAREGRPLFGRRVVVTQARSTSGELRRLLTAAGAIAVHCPLIRITHPDPAPELDAAIGRLSEFRWIVFTSVHGVRGFWHRMRFLGRDARAICSCKVAAIGPGTARELQINGVTADVVPGIATADHLVAAVLEAEAGSPCNAEPFGAGIKVLFPHGNLALPTVPREMRAAGAEVVSPVVYVTEDETPPPAVLDDLRAGVDAILFCSPSAVRRFAALDVDLPGARIGCIGPTTADAARDEGFTVDVVPSEPGCRGLVAALEESYRMAGVGR